MGLRYLNTHALPLKSVFVGTKVVCTCCLYSSEFFKQFYITTGENLEYLDEKHTVFGQVAEGLDVLTQINNTFTDKKGRCVCGDARRNSSYTYPLTDHYKT